MGCDLVFKVTGKLRRGLSTEQSSSPDKIVIPDSSLLSDVDLQGLLETARPYREVSLKNIASELAKSTNKNHKNDLVKIIKDLANLDSRWVTSKDIEKEGIVGNFKYHTLQGRYAGNKDVKFYDLITPYDPDILLVDKFYLDGADRKDMIYGTDVYGNKVFIVEDSERGVNKLNRHLRLRDLILNKFTGNQELENVMSALASLGKSFDTQQDLLLDFITHKSEYANFVGIYGLLSEITKNLENEDRNGFTEPLDREFSNRLDPVRGSRDWSIPKKTFFEIVRKYNPELLENIKIRGISDETLTDIFNKFYENFSEFTGTLVKITDKNLIIFRNARNLENVEDATYDTINDSTIEQEVYKGYHIYKYIDGVRVRYLYSLDKPSPKMNPKFYAPDETGNIPASLYKDIDKRVESDTFSEQFEIGFRSMPEFERVNEIYTSIKHIPGSIVQVLNVPLNKHTILDPNEKKLLVGKYGLKDFFNEFKKQLTDSQFQTLRDTIDSIEDAGIFIYLVNERIGSIQSRRDIKEKDSAKFDGIIQQISNAKANNDYKRFFIQSKALYTKVIPYQDNIRIHTKYQRPTPIIALMDDVIAQFNKRFGIGAEVLTQDEIDEKFSGEIPVGTKAFIRNGKIYINGSIATSEDVVHEYAHLFLGVLKATNFDMYMRLLDRIMQSKASRIEKFKTQIRERYKNLASPDLAEEVFAAAFGDYLSGKSPDNMFKDVKEEVDNAMKNIFTIKPEDQDEFFSKAYNGKFQNIFERFCKDISRVGSGLDYGKGTIYRQASNWISEQIKLSNDTDGKEGITEKNCV